MDWQTIFGGAITTIIGILTPFIIDFFRTKSEESKAKREAIKEDAFMKKIAQYVATAKDTVESSVAGVAQSFVDDKRKMEDLSFRLSEADKQLAFNMAKETIDITLSSELKTALKIAYGDYDTWINNQILYYVRKDKRLC